MRIECPACATAYEVPADRLAIGQVVRCARCGSDWTPLLPEQATARAAEPDQPALAEPPEPEPEPLAPEPEPAALVLHTQLVPVVEQAPQRHERLALSVAWALSLLLIAGTLWAAYAQRDRVMHAWPPSTRAYATLGLLPKR